MRVTRFQVQAFLYKVALTREREASCDDCAHHSARLVEALLNGPVAEQELLDILYHLEQCVPCYEEFVILRDCARMDMEDSWPPLEHLQSRAVPRPDA